MDNRIREERIAQARAARIRLFETTKGIYYRNVWVAGSGKNRKSLGTSDRAEANRVGTRLLAALLRQEDVIENGALRLKYLWERYSKESPDFLDNTPRTRKEDEAHVRVLMDYFGEKADVRNFTDADVRAFTAKRLAGGILLESGEGSTAVRARTPEIELRILKTMLRWAMTIRTRGGQRLLASDPLAGIRGDREANPKRPVASWEGFTAIRKAMQELAAKSENQRGIRMEFALVLSEATGRRIGSIRRLAWTDFDMEASTLLWWAETDKKRKQWLVPMPPTLLEEIRRFRWAVRSVDWCFLHRPIRLDRSGVRCSSTRSVMQRHTRSYRRAADGILSGGSGPQSASITHRRMVLAAGGWSPKSASVLTECYQFPDNETMLAVMSEPLKRSEACNRYMKSVQRGNRTGNQFHDAKQPEHLS